MYQVKMLTLVVALMAVAPHILAQRSLGQYNVDNNAISASGISSGASMAIQFHVAFSSQIMGVGSVAGSAYYCAKGSVTTALNACMKYPSQVNVDTLVTNTNTFASQGKIDQTSNMQNSKVMVIHGKSDLTVYPDLNKPFASVATAATAAAAIATAAAEKEVHNDANPLTKKIAGESEKIVEYYGHYVTKANIKTHFDFNMGHAHPTTDYGSACSATRSPYINDCDYHGSFEILNWIYGGNLQRPSGTVPLTGDFYQFDQKEFFGVGGPSGCSMDTTGYVYIPSRCLDSQKACKLHVAFHGCVQGAKEIGEVYVRNAGYNEVAELNDIIILYPQAIKTAGSNPNGCWDWWNYDDANYANKNGPQMKGVMAMVNKIQGPSE